MSEETVSFEQLLEERGEKCQLSGNKPLDLVQKQAGLWVVTEGKVDVFTVLEREKEDIYERQHFCRQERGEGLLAIAPARVPAGLKLRAVGKTGTEAVFLSAIELKKIIEAGNYSARLAKIFDSWLTACTEAITLKQPPRKFISLVPASTLESDPDRPLHPLEEVVWIRSSGSAQYLGRADLPELEAGDLFPLTPSSWASCEEALQVETFSTQAVLEEHSSNKIFDVFHSLILRGQVKNMGDRRSREKERRKEKREQDRQASKSALRQLASILQPGLQAPHARIETGLHPLVEACAVLNETLDMNLGLPGDTEEMFEQSRDEPLSVLARQSAFRTRRVRLEGDWWETDSGPLVAYKSETGEPVALIPQGDETYELYDPEDKSYRTVDKEVAGELKTSAAMLYRALPDKELTGWDLLKFSAAGLKKQFFLLLLMGAAGGLLGMLTPIITGFMFDEIIPGAQRGRLVVFIGGLFVAAVASTLFDLTRNFALLSAEGKMQGRLQPAVWDRLLNLPMPFFSEYKVGDLAQRAGGIMAIRQALSGATLTTILSGVFSIFSFFLLFYYSPILALLASGLTLVAIILMGIFSYFKIKYNREMLELGGELSSRVLELIRGISKIRVAGAEERAFSRWADIFTEKRKYSFRAGRIGNLQGVFDAVFQQFGKVLIFGVVAFYLITPDSPGLTTGSFLAFMSAFGQFFSAGLSMASTVVGLVKIVPLYERARPIMETTPEVDRESRQPGELEGSIEMQGVDFRYEESEPLVLEDVSLAVEPGQMVSLVGPSGSGKSTLMRLILGFERPESGSIYIDGMDLAKLNLRAVRRQIGVVMQDAEVQTGSIFKNIVGARPFTRDDAWEAARMCGLAEEIEEMPMGMDTHVSEGGGTLSGGQRQRLLIARALVHKPRVVFFDEATSALDNKTQKTVTESLNGLDATRIVIAHRLSTIREADKIYVVEEGKITETGDYSELMEAEGAFYNLAKRQLA